MNTYSTHWCVTIRSPDDNCEVAQQLAYADATLEHILEHSAPRAPVLLAGDFNVFDVFEACQVVEYLTSSGLTDVFRSLNPDADGTTFQGNSWAPPGRLDYVFATFPVDLLDTYIDRDSLPSGDGSDLYPVIATLRFELPEPPVVAK